ncbi:hypothetical protein J6590_069583 [Homalodisca vitripennis]|nr:hypothetical protein J6590_069583 [Homalodisca vitripennis]
MAGIKICIGKKETLYVLGVYRPPSASLEDAFAQMICALEEMPNNNYVTCILRDLNVHSLTKSRENNAPYTQKKHFGVTLKQSVFTICVLNLCEVAVIRIKQGKTDTYIIGVYRNQGNLAQSLEVIAQTLEKIQTGTHNTILMADINIDCLDKKNDYSHMEDILKSHNMVRLELPPTRITPTSRTSIDCVCTNLQPEDLHVQILNTRIQTTQASYA